MDTQLNPTEINAWREILRDYSPAQDALTQLERYNGEIEPAFENLWVEKIG